MNCERARDLIGAHRDGELSVEDDRAVAAHLKTCRACSDIAADDDRIGRALRAQGRVPVPAGLSERVRLQLDHADTTGETLGFRRSGLVPLPGPKSGLRWGQQAAAMAAVCLLSIAATWWTITGSVQADRIEREILNAHVRSLLQETTVQVASSDQHTVRPWFAGRIDFSPVVKDLASDGFPLVGGRLDYIGERRVGVLVYKRNLHVINVFVWPASGPADVASHLSMRNGYNLLSWTKAGVTFWAISDLNVAELEQLSRLL